MKSFKGLSGAADIPACGGHFTRDGEYVPPDSADEVHATNRTTADKAGDAAPLAAVRAIREQVSAVFGSDEDDDGSVPATRILDGAAWLLEDAEEVSAVWGSARRVLWSSGEALMVTGISGVGKTSIAAQLLTASVGLRSSVLGFPVTECERVLYLAIDRPKQARRNLRRFFTNDEATRTSGRWSVWQGPPWEDFAVSPQVFLETCCAAGLKPGDRVIVDSIKDAAMGLSEDRVGAGYNRARQLVLAEGIDVLELHHMVKKSGDGPPKSIADVYGSNHLTNGAGSVLLIHGQPGDPVVTMLHLKQPDEDVGPLVVTHTERGDSVVNDKATDVVEIVRRCGAKGATADDVAVVLLDKARPSNADREKAKRRLSGAVKRGQLVEQKGRPGGSTPTPSRWFLAARADGES
ncbi:AAA family ATPase [Gordonia sp. NPDC058843]|uniref:AAA family ATPase n=1 Tax=Gordonia sp. NPDC058843 TaxID=3346648 RepID=UPI00368C0DB7